MLRRVRIWTGPVQVNEIAKRAEAAGYVSVLAGTEHIHVSLEDKLDGWGILESLDKLEADVGVKLGKAEVLR